MSHLRPRGFVKKRQAGREAAQLWNTGAGGGYWEAFGYRKVEVYIYDSGGAEGSVALLQLL